MTAKKKPPAVDTELHIEYVALPDLVRAPRNPQGHDIPELEAAIGRFGYIDPIIIDETSGAIVAGHGRLETLEAMRVRGDDPPKRIKVGADGTWLAPVLRGVDFDDPAEAEAYLLAANRLGELGVNDERVLAEMLNDLKAGPGLPGTGFTNDDLADLLTAISEADAETQATLRPDKSYEGFADNYKGRTIQSVIFTYPIEQYEWLVERLDRLRSDNGAESNAELILGLVANASGDTLP